MTETTLKAVMQFDGNTGQFKPAAHNLTAEKAEQKAAKLKSQGLHAQVLDQPSRHKGRAFKTCQLCQDAADAILRQQKDQAQDAPAIGERAQEE